MSEVMDGAIIVVRVQAVVNPFFVFSNFSFRQPQIATNTIMRIAVS